MKKNNNLQYSAEVIEQSCGIEYCITEKFGGELNLVVEIGDLPLQPPNLKSTNISYLHIYVWGSHTKLPNLIHQYCDFG